MEKTDILSALEASHDRLWELIENLSPEQMEEPGVTGDWSVKDILAHLARWEAELVKLLWQAKQGLKPTAIYFTSPNVDEVNARWQAESLPRPMDRVLEDFHGVRIQTIRRVEEFSDKDLADAHRFTWLGGKPLEEWIAGDSIEHEAEHAREIEAWKKERGL